MEEEILHVEFNWDLTKRKSLHISCLVWTLKQRTWENNCMLSIKKSEMCPFYKLNRFPIATKNKTWVVQEVSCLQTLTWDYFKNLKITFYSASYARHTSSNFNLSAELSRLLLFRVTHMCECVYVSEIFDGKFKIILNCRYGSKLN